MNESEIENELKKLRPAVPSRSMEEGIARDLAARVHTPQSNAEEPRSSWFTIWLDRLLWSGVGAAATAVAFALVQGASDVPAKPRVQVASHDAAPVDASALQQVLTTEEDLGWRDEGVRFDVHGLPVLKLTRTSVERQAWADLKNAGVIQVDKPRQETRWVPVTLH